MRPLVEYNVIWSPHTKPEMFAYKSPLTSI